MIHIRSAVLEDLEAIADFQQEMARETEGVPLDRGVLEKGIHAVFLDPTKGEYYVAEIEGVPVGALLTVREWSDWRNRYVIWIHSLYVVPDARRKGVFCQLYFHLKSMIETSEDLVGLRLYVHRSNEIAHSAYQSLGMDGDRYQMFEWMPED